MVHLPRPCTGMPFALKQGGPFSVTHRCSCACMPLEQTQVFHDADVHDRFILDAFVLKLSHAFVLLYLSNGRGQTVYVPPVWKGDQVL